MTASAKQAITLIIGGLDDSSVIALLEYHVAAAAAQTAPGSAHALNVDGLKAPGITFWSAWDGDTLLGTGALKRLDARQGEVKSMHTARAARRRGVGSALLGAIIEKSREEGLERLYLETGSWDYFAPAWALYTRHGFIECEPFTGYKPDRNSKFMTLALGPDS